MTTPHPHLHIARVPARTPASRPRCARPAAETPHSDFLRSWLGFQAARHADLLANVWVARSRVAG